MRGRLVEGPCPRHAAGPTLPDTGGESRQRTLAVTSKYPATTDGRGEAG